MSRAWALVASVLLACGSKAKEPEAPAPLPPPQPLARVSVTPTPEAPEVNAQAQAETAEAKARAQADKIARGQYVAQVAGCITCHTATNGANPAQPLAGGFEGKLPDGRTWHSPNITPDRETGIGAWTDEQVIAAIRTGVRPDGMHLLPIMPSEYYHRMTDADAEALVAYLRAQPAVFNRVARSKAGGLVPVDLEPPTGNVDPDDPRGHGQYLASLMHCAACHTPQSGSYAGHAFAGGMAFEEGGQKVVAPNITSDADTGIGRWPADDIVRVVRTMTLPDGSHVRGPMALYGDAWSHLTPDDARALATYVKSIPPVHHAVDEAPPAVSGLDRTGH